MSLRRDCLSDETVAPPAPRPGAFAEPAADRPATIASSLGIADVGPAKPFVPFAPQHPTPQPVGNVVDDVFAGCGAHDVASTGLFGKKSKKEAAAAPALIDPKAKTRGMQINVKKAMDKANAAVRKAASGAKALVKGATDLASGLARFDFKLYSDTFTAMLAVAKKANGTDLSDKNNYQAFAGDAKYKNLLKTAQAQEAKMTRTESQTKNVKGRESKVISRKIKGRNAACLGFARVTESDESKTQFGDLIYPPAQAAGIPTLVTLTANDRNGVEGMLPITGLVVEAIDVDALAANQGGTIAINMAEVKDAGVPASQQSLSTDEFEFQYSLCVHGLHVDEEKGLHVGPKVLVPSDKINDVSAYGIDTDDGVESALAHAIKGEKLDLLLLWTSFKLVQGAKGVASMSLDPAQKKAAQELFGSLDGMGTQNSFSEAVEAAEFAELNLTTVA